MREGGEIPSVAALWGRRCGVRSGWRGSGRRGNRGGSRRLTGHVESVCHDSHHEHAADNENAGGDHESGPSARPTSTASRRVPDQDGGPDQDGRRHRCRHQLSRAATTGQVRVVESSARAVTIVDPGRADGGSERYKDQSGQDQSGHVVRSFRPARHWRAVYHVIRLGAHGVESAGAASP